MKLSIFLVIGLFSFNAYTCPQLAGEYTCEFLDIVDESPLQLIFTQEIIDGETFYSGSGIQVMGHFVPDSIVANGQSHPLTGESTEGNYRAKCRGNKRLDISVKGKIVIYDSPIDSESKATVISDNELKIKTSLTTQFMGKSHKEVVNFLCKKN